MKLFQKTSVAVALTVVMIAAAIGIGQVRGSSAPAVPQAAGLDKSLSTSSYATWISDEAEVLSDQEERQICLYNANWVARYDSLIAVATVREVSGDIADYAYALGEQIQLGAADGILVVDTGTNNCYLAVGPDYPMTDEQVTSHLDRYLYENAMAGQFGTGVLSLFDGINQFYVENYGLGYLETSQNAYGGRSTGETVMSLVVLLVILVVIASVVDSLRYTSYRQRYYGVPNPPYLFRPILFWHGPAYGWYRRRWRRPPPPPPRPQEGPGGFGGSGRRLQRFPGAQRGLRLRWIFQWLPGRGLLPGRRLPEEVSAEGAAAADSPAAPGAGASPRGGGFGGGSRGGGFGR
ncbi:MAG: TPM domain-containing protein [Lawsonibacter sp.]